MHDISAEVIGLHQVQEAKSKTSTEISCILNFNSKRIMEDYPEKHCMQLSEF